MDYQYGNKKQWRRWLWNRIDERITNKRDGIILFLAGEDAADVAEAARRRIPQRNMIAVEKDQATMRKLRDDGILTINGNLLDVLKNWPSNRNVSAVIADFCCGLELQIMVAMYVTRFNPSFIDTVFAVNVLRGRDSSTAGFRGQWFDGIHEKHRGAQLYGQAMLSMVIDYGQDETSAQTAEEIDAAFQRAWPKLAVWTRPAFNSYRSTAGYQVFDSVVFISPIGACLRVVPKELGFYDRLGKLKQPVANRKQVRRTAAILAHHSRLQS